MQSLSTTKLDSTTWKPYLTGVTENCEIQCEDLKTNKYSNKEAVEDYCKYGGEARTAIQDLAQSIDKAGSIEPVKPKIAETGSYFTQQCNSFGGLLRDQAKKIESHSLRKKIISTIIGLIILSVIVLASMYLYKKL